MTKRHWIGRAWPVMFAGRTTMTGPQEADRGAAPHTEETTMIRILATTALALGLVAGVAQAQTTSAMGHDTMGHKSAMSHGTAMGHDTMGHNAMGHDTAMGHNKMGHDKMGHDKMGHPAS
ncbi:hypothetical protein [Acidiphilium sp. 20-67-58]|uniref:hypothetical protein n=2 Tax=unclassified Acidiphilium TaxID=2617493 RepID=UPI0025C47C52|nr:hypothetical protein [Acidiphilium sp. 20-67-58]